MVGQVAAALVGGVLVAIVLALVQFSSHSNQAMETFAGRNVAERLSALVDMAETASQAERRTILSPLDTPMLRTGWSVNPLVLEDGLETDFSRLIAGEIRRQIDDHVVRVGLRTPPPPPPHVEHEMFAHHGGRGPGRSLAAFGIAPGLMVAISIQLKDGSWLNAITPADAGDTLWNWAFLLPLLLMVAIVIMIALWMVHRSSRPLRHLAQAATRLGLDVNAPPLEERGPSVSARIRFPASGFHG